MLYIIMTVAVAFGLVFGGTFRYVLQLQEAENTVEFANPKIEEAVRHMYAYYRDLLDMFMGNGFSWWSGDWHWMTYDHTKNY